MPSKQAQLSYNDSYNALGSLTDRFGDRLESLDILDKLEIVSVLTFWQAWDTDLSSIGDSVSLAEAIEDYPLDLSENTFAALQFLGEVRPEALLNLTIAISHQILDEVKNQ